MASTTSNPEKEKPNKYSLFDIIGALVATSGLLGALGWYFGKSYYTGYYAAIGIPTGMVDISNNEFISQGAIGLVIFLLYSVVGLFGLFGFTALLIRAISKGVNVVSNRFLKGMNKSTKKSVLYFIATMLLLILSLSVPSMPGHLAQSIIIIVSFFYIACEIGLCWIGEIFVSNKESSPWKFSENAIVFFRFAVGSLLLVTILIHEARAVYKGAYETGCRTVSGKQSLFTVYSKNPHLLEKAEQLPGQEDSFKYTGYFGFVGKDYLILYKELSDENRNPKTIYYVPKSEIFSFYIVESKPSADELKDINDKCETIRERLAD